MGTTPPPATPAPTPAAEPTVGPVGFLQESSGNYSSIRLMSMIALIAAIVFSLILISPVLFNLKSTGTPPTIPPDLLYNGLVIVFGFLLAAFAPKALQKFAETKVNRPPSS